MKRGLIVLALLLCATCCFSWGFYGHRRINQLAVFLLPPEMIRFYKPHIDFLTEHAVDPDKRRYAVTGEAPRHYIDMDKYGTYPFDSLPRQWNKAVQKYSEDTLQQHGIVPWWIQTMLFRLTNAFIKKDAAAILKLSADIGHYIGDSHVPLHTSSNHNGQHTNQHGIHGFWESRIPELLADKEWDFFIGKASYIPDPLHYTWDRILESAVAADTVLRVEKELTRDFPADQKFAFEMVNGSVTRQYSSAFSISYDQLLGGMIERRMRLSIYSVASFWLTAWINAGQPDLSELVHQPFSVQDQLEFERLNEEWKKVPAGKDKNEH